MRRSRPALKQHQSPLVYMLAQVRIAPVMKMADFIPEVQDRLPWTMRSALRSRPMR